MDSITDKTPGNGFIGKIFDTARLFLFSGHYGSGKSEIAVNFALEMATSHRTAIVDFDIINPYFRTASARSVLEQKGVRVITPVFANTNVDSPALPADIYSLFDDKGIKAVFDVGGDSAGAKAVSRYRSEFALECVANYFVFNIRRPLTSTVDQTIDIFHEIEHSAHVSFTALIGNTNLLGQTSEADLLDGLDAAQELSKRLLLPIVFNACMGDRDETAAPAFYKRSLDLCMPVFHLNKHIFMEY